LHELAPRIAFSHLNPSNTSEKDIVARESNFVGVTLRLTKRRVAVNNDIPWVVREATEMFSAEQSPKEVMLMGSYKQFLAVFFALGLSAAAPAPAALFQSNGQDQGSSTGPRNVPAKSKLGDSGHKNKAGSSGQDGSAAQTDAQGKANTLGVTDDATSRKNKTKVHRNVSGEGKNGSFPKKKGGQRGGIAASGAESQR
jgi:hypothetical protein